MKMNPSPIGHAINPYWLAMETEVQVMLELQRRGHTVAATFSSAEVDRLNDLATAWNVAWDLTNDASQAFGGRWY